MDAFRILVLDLNPTRDVASALQRILATCHKPRFLIHLESINSQGPAELRNELAEKIPPGNVELILLVLSAKDLNRISPIMRSIASQGTPSVAVVEGGSLEHTFRTLWSV